jgi:phage/plasmid-associated DNA primase
MTKSFRRKEDLELGGRLMNEILQIMNWALEGPWLLRQEGFIPQENKSGANLRALATTLHEFIEDQLMIDPEARTFQDQVYTRYKEWCKDNGHAVLTQPIRRASSLEAVKVWGEVSEGHFSGSGSGIDSADSE